MKPYETSLFCGLSIQSYTKLMTISGRHLLRKNCFSQASATSSTSLREYFQNHYKQGATFEHSEYQAARSWSVSDGFRMLKQLLAVSFFSEG